MILDWYVNHGKRVEGWESIVVIQWDALVLGNIKKQFPNIKRGEIFLSGSRILDKNIENKWYWTRLGQRKSYLNFKNYLKENYGYVNKLMCSLFILQIFQRVFFEKWNNIKDKEIGMLEYKIPTYARIFKTPFYNKNLGVLWFSKKTKKREDSTKCHGN